MGVTVTNLIQGPADLYTAPFGATEPASTNTAIAAAPVSPWVDMGGTDGGVKLHIDQKYDPLSVDQIVDRPGSRLTARDFAISTNLAEPTLANLKIAMNDGTLVPGTAPAASTFEPVYATASTQPTYAAFLLKGWAPTQLRRMVILRKGLSTDKVESSYEKAKQTYIPITITGHYVTSSIAPIFVAEANA